MNNFAYGLFFNFGIRHQSWTDGEGLEEKKRKKNGVKWSQDNLKNPLT